MPWFHLSCTLLNTPPLAVSGPLAFSLFMPNERFSELECFVLGLVWQIGPCSAYDVRQQLRDSPSSQWSASAGAIYPLMRRLEKHRLLMATDDANDNRRRRAYSITKAGRTALRDWIGPPISDDVVTVMHDPLRSRARFLGLLSSQERSAWVKGARAALEDVQRAVDDWHDRHAATSDPFREVMTQHGTMDVQMRRAWLNELERRLDRAH